MRQNKLEVAANIAVIVAAIAVVLKFSGVMDRPAPPTSGRDQIPRYVAGDHMPSIGGLDLREAANTLLVVVNDDCKYCTEGMPFFKSLMERRNRERSRVVVLSRDSETDLETYLSKHQFVPDGRISIADATLKLHLTPTMLLVDGVGTVKQVWTGIPDANGKQEVLHAIE
jgi:hypothetical protein